MNVCRQSGFTLIELVVAVAIVAILAAIALPSYFEQMSRSKRTDGKNALMDLAARQEKYRFGTNTYTANLALLNMPATSADGHYTMQVVSATALAFEARAIPTASQARDKCEQLTITNAGVKGTINGNSRSAEECWR